MRGARTERKRNMRTLYLDCSMGAAGDMLSAALFELLDDDKKTEYLRAVNSLGLPGLAVEAESAEKCGIRGTHMKVSVNGVQESSDAGECRHTDEDHAFSGGDGHTHEHDHDHTHHGHTHLSDIEERVKAFHVSERVKRDALAVYRIIADAESAVHGVPVTDIHFHEVGSLDAIADVTGVCLLMEMLAPGRVCASPVNTGSGQVRCAHGILPVPAPATALILKGIPAYGGSIRGELCTPTGAALLKYFVTDFGDMPVIRAERIGYGMGKKDFEQANCLRAVLGESPEKGGTVCELSCNVDDMTPERIGFAMERLFEAGALEVYTVPVGMKKSRPGVMLCVMCAEKKREEILGLIFRHTTTLGVRENVSRRYTLSRSVETVETSLGKVRVKRSEGFGVVRKKYEYEDLAGIAREKNMPIDEIIMRISEEEKENEQA